MEILLRGRQLTILFDVQRPEVMGRWGSRGVSVWSGDPKPRLGEQWDCEVLSEWETGILVHPLQRVFQGEGGQVEEGPFSYA